MKLSESNLNEFQKKQASRALPTEFPIIDEKDGMHQIMTEVKPLLEASRCRTWRNVLMTHGEYPYNSLAQTFWYPKRGNLMLVWNVEQLFSSLYRPNPACSDLSSQFHDRGEVVGSQR